MTRLRAAWATPAAARTRQPIRVGALPVLGLAVIALGGGLWGALALLGVIPARLAPAQLATHGVLMTLGFLGTMIALERAVALGRSWGYLAPIGAGLGALLLTPGVAVQLGMALLLAGGLAFVSIYLALDRIERSVHLRAQAAGAGAWVVAAALWLAGATVHAIVPWLGAFLVLTIAGERLELSRAVRLSPTARAAFIGLAALLIAGSAVTIAWFEPGARIIGLALIGLAAWLARNDAARRTVRIPGVTRFIAIALLGGYAWLAVAGAIWLGTGVPPAGPAYDAALHALFLGFVIAMVFGHAPVILPSVTRLRLPYRRRFYVHLGLLHAGLLLRIVVGDGLGSIAAWQAGGVLDVVALLVFVGSTMAAVAQARFGDRRPNPTVA